MVHLCVTLVRIQRKFGPCGLSVVRIVCQKDVFHAIVFLAEIYSQVRVFYGLTSNTLLLNCVTTTFNCHVRRVTTTSLAHSSLPQR